LNLILSTALEIRLAVLFVLGMCAGGAANLAIYRLAWHPRSISPWSKPDDKAPARRPTDRLPLLGWLGLRREAPIHGRGFWVRPMLVELFAGVGLAALYWWEIGQLGLLPPELPRPATPQWLTLFHVQFAVHAVLCFLMLVASLIDVDEKIIPDTITVPGTLLALCVAALYPLTLLPSLLVFPNIQVPPNFWQLVSPEAWPFLRITSPNPWPDWLSGFPSAWSLAVGLGCWWLWCVALMPRSWYSRHGWVRALRLMLARLRRESATWRISVLGLIGSIAIAAVWFKGGPGWDGLLTALVGMAAAGGLVWLVRVVGTTVLGREAMGFGDVTLFAMLGAFLGWQTCLVIFFLAPFAGLVVGLAILILRRESEIPYGPFLCMAALVVIVCWSHIWELTAEQVFILGVYVPVIIVLCVGLMALMLGVWRIIRSAFR